MARWFWINPLPAEGRPFPRRNPPATSWVLPCKTTPIGQHAARELDLLDIILGSTVPVFFVIALGYFAGWTRKIDNHHVAELNALVMDFALPASLFVAMVQTPQSLLLEQGQLIIVLAVSMLVIYGLHFFLQTKLFKLDSREAAVGSLTSGLPNFASAGLPLISSVFGAANTVSVGISIAVGSIVMSPLTLVILEAGDKSTRDVPAVRRIIVAIGKSILKPVVIAPMIGMVLTLCDVEVPRLLDASLTLIGIGAGGVALFLTGLILSSQSFRLNGNVALGTVLKNVAHALLAAALVAALAVSPVVGRQAIILCAVPAGFFGILFGLRYGVVSQDSGSMLIASTLLSTVTIPAAILLTAGTH
jgi:malonate transporter and related proteins